MNNRLWVTLVAVTFASMVNAGSLTKQPTPSPIDMEEIELEAARQVAELNAPSPQQHALSLLAALYDKNGYSPTPEQVAKELSNPKTPVSLGKQTPPSASPRLSGFSDSASYGALTPRFRPIAIRISSKP